MRRSTVTVRPARQGEEPALVAVWSEILRRGTAEEQATDVAQILAGTQERDDQQIVVAESDGDVVGAVLLQVTTLNPLNLERVVLAVSPHVLPAHRRKGVGSALMAAAVRFAEQQGIGHVASAANTEARVANRFMARLALAPEATLRIATTTTIRSRLTGMRPMPGTDAARSRHIDRVLAARRTRRERVSY